LRTSSGEYAIGACLLEVSTTLRAVAVDGATQIPAEGATMIAGCAAQLWSVVDDDHAVWMSGQHRIVITNLYGIERGSTTGGT